MINSNRTPLNQVLFFEAKIGARNGRKINMTAFISDQPPQPGVKHTVYADATGLWIASDKASGMGTALGKILAKAKL
jgi:hypothetical protein